MSPAASPVERRNDRRRLSSDRPRAARFALLPKLRARALVALASLVALVSACSLDWTVRSDGIGPGADGGSDGAANDGASSTDGQTNDGQTNDGAVAEGGQACATLQAAIDAARARARSCTLGNGGCQTTVDDECGCAIVVLDKTSAKAMDFANAVAAFVNASCVNGACSAKCDSKDINMLSWACVGDPAVCFP